MKWTKKVANKVRVWLTPEKKPLAGALSIHARIRQTQRDQPQ